MYSIKLLWLLLPLWVELSLVASAQVEGAAVPLHPNDATNKTQVIQLDSKVITSSAVEPSLVPLTSLNITKEAANQVKSRKVTHVDSFGGTSGDTEKNTLLPLPVNSNSSASPVSSSSSNGSVATTTSTTVSPKMARVGLKVSENIYIDLANEPNNNKTTSTTTGTVNINNTTSSSSSSSAVADVQVENKDAVVEPLFTPKSSNTTAATASSTTLNHLDKNNTDVVINTAAVNATNTTATAAVTPLPTNVSSSIPSLPTNVTNATKAGNATTAKTNSNSTVVGGGGNNATIITIPPASKTTTISTTPSTTTTTTTTTTTSTTTTTTTTTTPKPKKPTITYGVEDFPDLDKENPAWHNLTQQQTASSKLPLPEAPYAQPSQEEFNNNTFHGSRDYILPIVSMIFIIPLVIGVLITTYRRFRDCWSTRHYRRMDFLVDGMYND